MKKLILLRGLPGSGKSTIADMFKHDYSDAMHFEADMYFFNDGEYIFDQSKLHQAHKWCMEQTDIYLTSGIVIVSNTFTTIKELRPYFEIALKHGILPTIILTQSQFGNIHNVPEETLQKMKNRFVYDISPLWNEFELKLLKGV
jgi:predicted kinase